VSDELLEDAVSIQQYVNGRLSMFVRVEEERQLLRGAGGNDLSGIFARAISTTTAGTTNADRIFRAAAGVRGSAFLDPDLIALHPTNWTTSRLQQDGAGQYFGGGPWGGQYGNTGGGQTSSFSSSPYWGMKVWVTPTVGAGTALVGSTQPPRSTAAGASPCPHPAATTISSSAICTCCGRRSAWRWPCTGRPRGAQ
jgi:hypothetical protein